MLAVPLPSVDLRMQRWLRAHPEWRVRAYGCQIGLLWALTSVTLLLRSGAGLRVPHLPGEPGWLLGRGWHAAVGGILLTALLAAMLSSGVRCLLQPRLVPAYTRAHAALAWFLPHTGQERRWWMVVSVTAGVTEEWIFRGYALHTLRGPVGFSLTAAMVLSSGLFGLGHLYQGWRGTLTAALLGFLFAMMAVMTGGLLLPMIVHAVIDLQILVIFQPDRSRLLRDEASPPVATALANSLDLTV